MRAYMRRFFKTQAPIIAAQINSALSKSEASDEAQRILSEIDLSGWAVIVGDVQDFIQKVGADGAKLAFLQLGGIPDDESIVGKSDKITREYARKRAAELVGMKWVDGQLVENPNAKWAITDSTRSMLQDTVTTAIDEGWSNDHLAQVIEDSFPFSSSRADTIARTELKRADSQGSLNAYKASGVVQGKESILSFDYDDDDECQDNADAGVIPIDDDFPSGDDAPPYHPNCRCVLSPALIDQSEDEDNV